jgi:hypothetical protein
MINTWLNWIDHTTVGTAIRQSNWLFPFIETFHLFGIVSLVASTSILDLRLLGIGPMRHWPVSKLTKRLLPWAWWGFAVQLVSGLLMTSSESLKNYHNPAFRLKMLLILLAAFNFWLFHASSYKRVAEWDTEPVSPLPARLAGMFSILLWFGIVAAGRFIAFY